MRNVRSGRLSRRSGRYPVGPTGPSGPGLLAQLERLDDIAELDVVEVGQRQTTLEALADLGSVVLEPLERRQFAVVEHDRAVAQQPHLGVALDDSTGDPATGDVADLGRAEDLADLRRTELDLFVDRLEHALQSSLDV